MISKQIIVTGHVQGVGFRNYVQKTAHDFGIIGWARNLLSGQVEILAQHSNPTQLDIFINKIRQGPARSKVDTLEIFDIDSRHIEGHTFKIVLDGGSKSEF